MPWWAWALGVAAVPLLGFISYVCLLGTATDYSLITGRSRLNPLYGTDRKWGWGCVTGLAAVLILVGLTYEVWHALVH
jgi:hypothetical protein